MQKTNPPERAFQSWVKQNWYGFSTQLHPGVGADAGLPDLLLLTPGGLIPAEVKIGSVIDGVLWCSEVRPAQIGWHKRLANAGGSSLFLVGVWSGEFWRIFAFDGLMSAQWETTGFKVGTEAIELDGDNLHEAVTNYLFEVLDV